MSYLPTNSSFCSNFSEPRAFSPLSTRRSNFTKKYDKLLKNLSDTSRIGRNDERNSFLSNYPKNSETQSLYSISSTIESRKSNPIKAELLSTKYNFLTGRAVDTPKDFFSINRPLSPIQKYSNDYFTTLSGKNNDSFKELKKSLKKRTELNLSKMFKNKRNTVFTFQNNNTFIEKMKQTFPQYINLNTNGESFISSGKNGKIEQLKYQLSKL